MYSIVPVVIEDCKWDEFNLLLRNLQNLDFTSDLDRARLRLLQTWGIEDQDASGSDGTETKQGSIRITKDPQTQSSSIWKWPTTSMLRRYVGVLVVLAIVVVVGVMIRRQFADAEPAQKGAGPKDSDFTGLAITSSQSPSNGLQQIANQIKSTLARDPRLKGQKLAIGYFDGADTKAKKSSFGIEVQRQLKEMLGGNLDEESDFTLSGDYCFVSGDDHAQTIYSLIVSIKHFGKPLIELTGINVPDNVKPEKVTLESGLNQIASNLRDALATSPMKGKKLAMGRFNGEGPIARNSKYGTELRRRLGELLREYIDDESDDTLAGTFVHLKGNGEDQRSVRLIVTIKHLGKVIVWIPEVEINESDDVDEILGLNSGVVLSLKDDAPSVDKSSRDFEGTKAGDAKELVPGIMFRWCPSGKFTMGEDVSVQLTSGFWLGETEVTQGQWQKLIGTTRWSGKDHVVDGEDYPASYISFGDAILFCETLTTQERNSGRLPNEWKYNLPTEAQWEYACRAGTKTSFSFGDDASALSDYGWFYRNAETEKYAHRVGQKKPNAWGLANIHGNLWDWCSDWKAEKLHGGRDPVGPPTGSDRMIRGGSWSSLAEFCSSANRGSDSPDDRDGILGFRLSAVPIAR